MKHNKLHYDKYIKFETYFALNIYWGEITNWVTKNRPNRSYISEQSDHALFYHLRNFTPGQLFPTPTFLFFSPVIH